MANPLDDDGAEGPVAVAARPVADDAEGPVAGAAGEGASAVGPVAKSVSA